MKWFCVQCALHCSTPILRKCLSLHSKIFSSRRSLARGKKKSSKIHENDSLVETWFSILLAFLRFFSRSLCKVCNLMLLLSVLLLLLNLSEDKAIIRSCLMYAISLFHFLLRSLSLKIVILLWMNTIKAHNMKK